MSCFATAVGIAVMDHDDDGMLSDDEIAAHEAAEGPTASRLFFEG